LGATFPPPVAIVVKFCTAKRTQVTVGHAKFDMNWCNESPLRGEKPDFGPVSKFNTGSLPLCGILPVIKQNCEQCYIDRSKDCTHPYSERGFWTTAEMEKGLKKGYKIDKIYEVWHFEHSSTELWKKYVRKFLKIKLETSKFTCSEEEYRQKPRRFAIEF